MAHALRNNNYNNVVPQVLKFFGCLLGEGLTSVRLMVAACVPPCATPRAYRNQTDPKTGSGARIALI